MPNQKPEEQSWPPSPTSHLPLSLTGSTGLPRGLKIGLAAAPLGTLFTFWQLIRFNRYHYSSLGFLPDMPTHTLSLFLWGRLWIVFLSLPMLAVLALAGVGLAIGLRDWRVSRCSEWHKGIWAVALGFLLNLLPFAFFAEVFVQRGWVSVIHDLG